MASRFKKEGRCFGYGEKGYLPIDPSALYKGKKWIPNKRIIFQIKSIKVFGDDNEFEDEQTSYSLGGESENE